MKTDWSVLLGWLAMLVGCLLWWFVIVQIVWGWTA